MSSSGGGIPVLQSMKMSSLSKPSTVRDLGFAVMKIVGYMGLGCLLYIFPELNSRPGEDDMPVDWSWDVIDCCYFTMVTITTVGYGDMPTLTHLHRQRTPRLWLEVDTPCGLVWCFALQQHERHC